MVKLSLRVAALLAVLSSLMVLGACGGGASSGSTGAAGNTSILNALDASSTSPDKLPEGADSVSLSSFWEAVSYTHLTLPTKRIV